MGRLKNNLGEFCSLREIEHALPVTMVEAGFVGEAGGPLGGFDEFSLPTVGPGLAFFVGGGGGGFGVLDAFGVALVGLGWVTTLPRVLLTVGVCLEEEPPEDIAL